MPDIQEPWLPFGLEMKTVAVLVPIIGSVLAVCYDVGYFSGIDIHYFTVFALSEHVLFAIQILPFTLGLALGIVCGAPGAAASHKRLAARARLSPEPVRVALAFALIGSIGIPLVAGFPSVIAGLIAFISFAYVFKKGFQVLAAAVGFSGVLMVTMMLGSDFAYKDINAKAATNSVEEGSSKTLQGRIIRSGDKGLLFLDTQKHEVTLIPWREIKEVRNIDHRGAVERFKDFLMWAQ